MSNANDVGIWVSISSVSGVTAILRDYVRIPKWVSHVLPSCVATRTDGAAVSRTRIVWYDEYVNLVLL